MANKKRRCRQCKSYKIADKGVLINGGFYCSIDHATKYAFKNKERGRKVKHREQKKELKSNDVIYQHKLTQVVFNRLRVMQEIKWFNDRGLEPECISCGKVNMDWCCGHYKSRGAQGNLRYDPLNTFLQCNRYCNMALSGNISGNKNTRGYEVGLTERFGDEHAKYIMDYCESNTEVKKWTGEELQEMRKEFNRQIKLLL